MPGNHHLRGFKIGTTKKLLRGSWTMLHIVFGLKLPPLGGSGRERETHIMSRNEREREKKRRYGREEREFGWSRREYWGGGGH